MPLTSILEPYNPQWPHAFESEAEWRRPIFDVYLLETHHVGSTAVPELSAKPEIDILAIVSATILIDHWAKAFAARGYRRGGDLSAGHHFFKT